MHVFPTVPSPTTTHFIGLPDDICNNKSNRLLVVVGVIAACGYELLK